MSSFNLRNAVGAGLATGLTAGIGAVSNVLGGTSYADAAAAAISGSLAGYAGNRIAGVNTSFSWRSVAASAVSAAVTAGVSQSLGFTPNTNLTIGSSVGFRSDVANGLIGALVSLHTRRAFGFGDNVDYGNIAADAFGNALAQSAGRRIDVRSITRMAQGMPSDGSSFLERYPNALASLQNGDVPQSNEIDFATGNALLRRELESRYDAGGAGLYPYEDAPLEIDVIGGRRESETVTLETIEVRPSPEDLALYQASRSASMSAAIGNVLGRIRADQARQPTQFWQQPIEQRLGLQSQPSGPVVNATPELPLRDRMIQGMRDSALGRDHAGQLLIGVTDAYLQTPEVAIGIAKTLASIQSPIDNLGRFQQDLQDLREKGVGGTISARFGVAKDRMGGAMSALQTGAFQSMYGQNNEINGRVLVNAASMLLAPERLLGSKLGALEGSAANSEVWKLNPFLRGQQIEQGLGHNLPSNFPTVDRFDNGIVTSIKSIDLNAPSYLNDATLNRTLTSYVDKVAAFNGRNWAGRTIESDDILGRGLDLAIPHSGNVSQQAIINQAIRYGATRGVVVSPIIYP